MNPKETAYPLIKKNISEKELISIYTPIKTELFFVEKWNKSVLPLNEHVCITCQLS